MSDNYKHFDGEKQVIGPSEEGAVIESNDPTPEEIQEGNEEPSDPGQPIIPTKPGKP